MTTALPALAVNRGFMAEFIETDPPCFALGLVKVEGTRCTMVALRPEQAIPQLGRVPKTLILNAVREGADTSAAARLAGTTKEVMAADAAPVAMATK